MAVDSSDPFYPQIAVELLAWYDANARVLPWRAPPGMPAPDPYRVWLSEIMLQQTTVPAVRPYFERFTARWPDAAALAAADEAELMAAWAGLGYYARARNLIACARKVAAEHGGRFPDTEAELRALPGIGTYTAAAIAAIAFGKRAVVMDANVERVVARIFAFEEPLPAAKSRLYDLTDHITPNERSGDFAQAMMDLGATICSVRAPKCLLCPLSTQCAGKATPERYPVKLRKSPRPQRRGSIFWAERDGEVLLCRRPDRGLLGGMMALPTGPWTDSDPGLADAPDAESWQSVGTIRHDFTHFALDAEVYRGGSTVGSDQGVWWPIERIDQAGLPTLFAKAAALVLETNHD
ncbi:MAG: A/G-specific adenine glycosylase [Sphingomonadaceae bacterium]